MESQRLDRQRWHQPLVSVIITHHNYSHHVEDALLSVLDQTYENWECVVVDDASEPHHQQAVERIVNAIASSKISLLKLTENVGQTPAAFAGLDNTSGEFVCILDPDDRYAQTFIEEALAGHLNETIFCPVLSTDQYLMANGSLIAGTYTHQRLRFTEHERGVTVIPDEPQVRLLYFPPSNDGWHWGSSSSLMFRRAAVELMRPPTSLTWFRSVDSYLAQGAHRLGGTLFLTKSLVYRTVHSENSYLVNRVISIANKQGKYDGPAHSRKVLQDALAAIKANGGEVFLDQRSQARRVPRTLHNYARFLSGNLGERTIRNLRRLLLGRLRVKQN